MNLDSIWSALEESSEILFDHYAYPAADKAAEELSLPSGYYAWVMPIWIFDADPFSITEFMRYFPYGLAKVNDERLTSAVRQGYLTLDSQGIYHATESGRTAALRLMQVGNERISALAPLSNESLRTLGDLLAQISDAAFHSPEPPAHVLIKAKRNLYQRTNTFALLEGFVAHCLLLEGRRDDCYIATWSAHGVEGHTWEVLDMLSHNESLMFADLHKKLGGRGVTEEVHAEDVLKLARRGWVDDASEKVQITSAGKKVRAEVEAETEHLFFAPWSCLNEIELEELASLADQMRDRLRAFVGQK